MVPFGLLHVAAAALERRHIVRILDLAVVTRAERRSMIETSAWNHLDAEITAFEPDVIGFGGIASSLGRTRRLSDLVAAAHPSIILVAGGGLAFVAAQLVASSAIHAVFVGEAEDSFQQFLDRLGDHDAMQKTPGLVWYESNSGLRRTPAQSPPEDLDTLAPLPFHLVNPSDYSSTFSYWCRAYESYFASSSKSKDVLHRVAGRGVYFPVLASRGCLYRCSFCCKPVSGVRRHSPAYVYRLLRSLEDRFGFSAFHFADELFSSSRSWILEFCSILKQSRADFAWLATGMRVDSVDRSLLRSMKEAGCVEVDYGQESGSQVILDELRKGTTVEANISATNMTAWELGLPTGVQLVIGSPSESSTTIAETVRFLSRVRAERLPLSVNYLTPFPETPIWREVERRGLVPDLEAYLDDVAHSGCRPLLNLTSARDEEWRGWADTIRRSAASATRVG